jgi:peptidoglycan/xylan/chitin deacetylase (PgdA/CDA1 family)
VSICFDDFPRTAYTVGSAVLRSFGVAGTYYAAMGLMNTQNHLGDQFTRRDLEGLLAEGHELASHTFSHLSCRRVRFRDFEKDVRRGQEAIRDAVGVESVNFAYPYGDVTLVAKRMIGSQMKSCRGIYRGVNLLDTDLNLLRANALYGDQPETCRIERLILEAQKKNGWLILYTHDVGRRPSRFGCTPSLLETALSFACERGLSILPVGAVVSELLA